MLGKYKYLIPEESDGVVTEGVKELRNIENNLRKIFEDYKCKEILVSTFEYVELYKKVYENFDEDKTYNYIGKDGKVIASRWDFTIPIARHYSSQTLNNEARYSYFGTVYRKEKKYKGRSSESYQAGIELISSPKSDPVEGNMECLEILQNTLPCLGIKNLVIEFGSAKFFKRICDLVEDKDTLVDILHKKNLSEMARFVKEKNIDPKISKLLLKLPRLCGDIHMLDQVIDETSDEVILKSLKELKTTYENMKIKDNIIFDLSMCPNMEYYTCLMFKVYSKYSPDPIIAGGRYDLLYKNFKVDVKAIGMGYYLNNILKALLKEGEVND